MVLTFILRHKKLSIFLVILFICLNLITFFTLYWFFTEDSSYQMVLTAANGPHNFTSAPLKVGTVVNNKGQTVDTNINIHYINQTKNPLTPHQVQKFPLTQQGAISAINQILGQAYSKQWVAEIEKGAPENAIDYTYKMFPYTLCAYLQYGLLPSTQLAQTMLESGYGGENSNGVVNPKLGCNIYDNYGGIHWFPNSMLTNQWYSGAHGPSPVAGHPAWAKFSSPLDFFMYHASMFQKPPYDGGSADPNYLHLPSNQEAVLTQDSFKGQIKAIVTAGYKGGTLSAMKGYMNTLLNSFYTPYNLAKFDAIAKEIKISLYQNNNSNNNNLPLTNMNPNWKPNSGSGGNGKGNNIAWTPAGAKTVFNFYHINSSGLNTKIIQAIQLGASLMGSPYVWGSKGYFVQSKAWLYNQIITKSGGSSSQYDSSLHYMENSNLPLNGTVRGFDCSGFTGYVFSKVLGIDFPEGTSSQLEGPWLEQISQSQVQPGDLVYYYGGSETPGNSIHVGIFMYWFQPGWPAILESPCSGNGVEIWVDSRGVPHNYYKFKSQYL